MTKRTIIVGEDLPPWVPECFVRGLGKNWNKIHKYNVVYISMKQAAGELLAHLLGEFQGHSGVSYKHKCEAKARNGVMLCREIPHWVNWIVTKCEGYVPPEDVPPLTPVDDGNPDAPMNDEPPPVPPRKRARHHSGFLREPELMTKVDPMMKEEPNSPRPLIKNEPMI